MFLLIPNNIKSRVSPSISWYGIGAIVYKQSLLYLIQDHETLESNEQRIGTVLP